MPKRSKSSAQWLKQHFDDEWVKKARALGYRSRASFKLLEINDKEKLIKQGMRVLDLGAAPGGWSQVAIKLVGRSGQVIATDILPIDALPHVNFIQGDFTDELVQAQISNIVGAGPCACPAEGNHGGLPLQVMEKTINLVLSDMAPNMSGIPSSDLPRAMALAELALEMALTCLSPQGSFLVKVFQGEGFPEFRQQLLKQFTRVKSYKPKASRAQSREVYLLAQGLYPKRI